MIDYQIYTKRFKLIPITVNWLKAMQEGRKKFTLSTGYTLPNPYTEFPELIDQLISDLQTLPTTLPWTNYAIIKLDELVYVGQVGFKGQPNHQGEIEIGYEIAHGFRNKGFAHEVIESLISVAFVYPGVNMIIAHTLPQKNESNHLLIKNKFVWETTVVDPDDGPVWKWVLKKKAFQLAKSLGC